MKKLGILCLVLVFLAGCGGEGAYETVQDVYAPQVETPQKLSMSLPEEASVTTISGSLGTLYLCDGYTIAVETMSGGDLGATVKAVTGFSLDRLTLMAREQNGISTYRCVWTATGETGEQVARCLILDDGKFHYAVTVMAGAAEAAALEDTWQALFASVSIG